MSDDSHDRDDERGEDDEVLALLADTFTREGELIPTDEDEVLRAERAGVDDVDLPDHLADLPPPKRGTETAPASAKAGPDSAVDLGAYRRRRAAARPWLSHTGALILGAAAALALTILWGDDVRSPLGLGTDPATGSSSSATPPPLRVELPSGCADCCGGEDCARPRQSLRVCSSGRRCLPCAAAPGSRFRLRLGAVHLAEAGRAVVDLYPQGEPELCIRVGASDERCGPTLVTERPEATWRSLPLVAAAEDLSAKVAVRLRWKGVQEPQATAARWISPVAVTPTALCMGYTVKLETPAAQGADESKLFGTASLFLDDAHQVELARAADVASLQQLGARLELSGLRAVVQETSAAGADRFVLGFGPFDQPTAEKVRWQLAEQGQAPRLSEGADYVGEPLPLEPLQ